jgi:hypothetical protein
MLLRRRELGFEVAPQVLQALGGDIDPALSSHCRRDMKNRCIMRSRARFAA